MLPQQFLPQTQAFIEKHHDDLIANFHQTPRESIKARIINEKDLNTAAEAIRNGGLVAFPTETVYGLGANAFNEKALSKIYETKRRPLTDPIIVHVLDSKQALSLLEATESEKKLFLLLTENFWPGPLTLILKANLALLPMMVTAQTGFVGIRAPKHPYARKLIEASGVPIGAPSANLFSHVSPTEPLHVFNDFYSDDISIVNGERCEYGVESTVLKIVEGELHVLREGSFLTNKIQAFLDSQLGADKIKMIVHQKKEKKDTNMEAPGQLLKHYAPNIPCCYINEVLLGKSKVRLQDGNNKVLLASLSEVAIISFGNKFENLRDQVKFYFEVGKCLQEKKGEEEKEDIFCLKQDRLRMRQIYFLLRKCQNLPVVGIVVGWEGPETGTLWDKIMRSTQSIQGELLK